MQKTDSAIYDLIKKEGKRQAETLMMIPSENTASYAVEEAVGSSLGNKYAEGYPGRRYYQGQEVVDQIETLAIERAKKLFNVPFVNVQALSGSPANFAVYTALLNPGDTIMGLSLSSGGHLTHGASLTASSKYFRSVQYDVGKDGWLDYKVIEALVMKEKPKLIVAGTTAYPRLIDWKKFADIAKKVGAYLMTDIAHIAGLIAAGAYPSPVPYADVITTTTHKTLRGPRGALIMVTEKGLKKNPDLGKKINSAIIPGIQGGPHLNNIAGIAVALKEASTPRFRQYAKKVIENAAVLASELTKYDFALTTKGTDSHLLLIDLTNKGLIGNTAAEALEAVNIVLNRNSVPYDKNPPFYPSGIRLGTPGITSRGMGKNEMKVIAKAMNDAITATAKTKEKLKLTFLEEKDKVIRRKIITSTKELKTIRGTILNLCKKFPLKKVY